MSKSIAHALRADSTVFTTETGGPAAERTGSLRARCCTASFKAEGCLDKVLRLPGATAPCMDLLPLSALPAHQAAINDQTALDLTWSTMSLRGRQVTLDRAAIQEVASLLERTRSVPMPGGHGFRFADLREANPHFGCDPSVSTRCAVVVIMLGLGEEHGRFFRKGWMPFAQMWFERHASDELRAKVGGERWQYMLAAMVMLAEQVLPAFDLGALDATKRIKDYLKSQRRVQTVPVPRRAEAARSSGLPGIQYEPLSTNEGSSSRAWAAAKETLCGPHADICLMLFTIHALHANLGVPQYPMDSHHDSREPLYRRIAALMRGTRGAGCDVCRVAHRVASALERTRAFGSEAGMAGPLRLLVGALPSCFQPAHLYSNPPLRATLQRRLADAPRALDLLLAATELAEAMADRMIDPLWRSTGADVELLSATDFDLFLNNIKHGAATYKRDFKALSLPPKEDPSPDVLHAVTLKAYFENVGNLSKAAEYAMNKIRTYGRPTATVAPTHCSLCVSPPQDREGV